MLEHMVLNCEDDEKEVTNEDIEEEGEISGLVKCQVCACEEVKKKKNYISGYRMNFCDSCFVDIASAV